MAQAGLSVLIHITVEVKEITVYLLHQVGAVLIAAVYAALQLKRIERIDVRVADNVFQMPLHRIYPAFQIQTVLQRVAVVGVADGMVHIIGHMVIVNGMTENLVIILGV